MYGMSVHAYMSGLARGPRSTRRERVFSPMFRFFQAHFHFFYFSDYLLPVPVLVVSSFWYIQSLLVMNAQQHNRSSSIPFADSFPTHRQSHSDPQTPRSSTSSLKTQDLRMPQNREIVENDETITNVLECGDCYWGPHATYVRTYNIGKMPKKMVHLFTLIQKKVHIKTK